MFSVAAPARTRVLVAEAKTLQAAAAATPMPPGAATVAFTRFARPQGPIGQRAFAGTFATVVDQGIAGTVRAAAPPVQLDGIAQIISAPTQLPPTATGIMVTPSVTISSSSCGALNRGSRTIVAPKVRQGFNATFRP